MASKDKETIAERAARLAAGTSTPAPKTEKTEKRSHYVKKGGNGGARAGSGRKPEEERKAENRQGFQDFAAEKIKARYTNEEGKVVEKQMTRMEVARMKLFTNVLAGDLPAIKEFNDRTMAKAMQPLGGSDAEPIALKVDF